LRLAACGLGLRPFPLSGLIQTRYDGGVSSPARPKGVTMERSRVAIGVVLVAAGLFAGCRSERPVVISVGDPAAEAWQRLKDAGHTIALIPLDGRIEKAEPTPDGKSTSELVGMLVPYDINGRVVLFGHRHSDDTISSILVDGTESVDRIEVPKATRRP